MTLSFTGHDARVIEDALRLAAKKYAANASDLREGGSSADLERLAKLFDEQATDALRVAERFE